MLAISSIDPYRQLLARVWKNPIRETCEARHFHTKRVSAGRATFLLDGAPSITKRINLNLFEAQTASRFTSFKNRA